MKLAILSDIHDNVWNLSKVLAMQEFQATDAMIFCGDLCAPFIIKMLGLGYSKPIHLVLGNNDGDLNAIISNAGNFPHIYIHGEYFKGEFAGRTLAANHYPDKARKLAENGGFDVVCYGHNHTLAQEKVGQTLLINPGAVMGFHGGRLEDITPTFVVIDTDSLKVEIHEL